MAEYIEREALIKECKRIIGEMWNNKTAPVSWSHAYVEFLDNVEHVPLADVAPVVHGRWELTTHSFYRDTFDESCELCVYIVANCSECSGKHPNSYQVFSKTLYAPDDADDDFRFDQKVEEEKALLEFRNQKYEFAYYCPNCGANMDLED